MKEIDNNQRYLIDRSNRMYFLNMDKICYEKSADDIVPEINPVSSTLLIIIWSDV